jgi:hypothetical protein
MPAVGDVVLTYTDAGGDQTVLNANQYAITGVGTSTTGGATQGGTVTYPLAGSPIAAGTSLTLQRMVPTTQPVSLANQGGLWPGVVEASDDNLEMQIQQFTEQVSRALLFNAADVGPFSPLPPASRRAGLALLFDANGEPYAGGFPAGSIPISSAMQPVVGASTLTQAVYELGLTPVAVEAYGAVGNGTTDDSAAINAALAANVAVCFRPGKTYYIGSSLVVPITCQWIVGTGATVTGPGTNTIGGTAGVTVDGFTFSNFYQGAGELIPVDSFYRLPSIKNCRSAIVLTNAAWVNIFCQYIQFCTWGIYLNASGSGGGAYCLENNIGVGTLEFCTAGITLQAIPGNGGVQGNQFNVFYMAGNSYAINGYFGSTSPVFINNLFLFTVCDGAGGPGTPVVWIQDFAAGGSNRFSAPGGVVGYAANTNLFLNVGPTTTFDALGFQGSDPYVMGWPNFTIPGPRTRLNSGSAVLVQVSPSGSDATGNGSAAAPFATLNGAFAHIQHLDMMATSVQLQLAAGTYAGGLTYNAIGGSNCRGQVTIAGNTGNPGTVTVSGSIAVAGAGAYVYLEGITVTGAGATVSNGADVIVGPSVLFGGQNSGAYHLSALSHGRITIESAYLIAGGGGSGHIFVADQGQISLSAPALVTLSGTPAYSIGFAVGTRGGIANLGGMTFAGTGATGPKFDVVLNAVIDTGTGNTSYLPGSTAGTYGMGGVIN